MNRTSTSLLSIAFLLAACGWIADVFVSLAWSGEMSLAGALLPTGDAMVLRLKAATLPAVVGVIGIAAFSRATDDSSDLFHHLPDGAFRSAGDGQILTVNPALVQMLGFSSEEEMCAITNARELFRDSRQREKLFERVRKDGHVRNVEVDLRRRNGKSLTVRANIRAVEEDAGDAVVYEGTLSDVSDLLRIRDALAESAEHCRALTEYALDVVTIIDDQRRRLYASPSITRLTGYESHTLIGQDVLQHVHEDDRDTVSTALQLGFKDPGTPQLFTYRFRHSDGSILYLESVGAAYISRKKQSRAVVHTRNVTKRRRTEAQLQQAQKMQALGQLTGGIAHDFNNLLTIIVGNLQLVEEADIRDDLRAQICTALRASLQGAELTRRLLVFSRRQFLEPKVIDVNNLLSGMEAIVRRSLGDRMGIITDYAQDLWLAKVDPAQLESAILNLAINSRDSTDGRGSVVIKTMNCCLQSTESSDDMDVTFGDRVCIVVEDNGCGMSEETLKHVFDPFFSTKENGAGTGLGLSMVYGFVKQSGGHIQLASKEGQGTTIKIYLPRSQNDEADQTQSVAQLGMPTGSETILVVDDNKDVRTSVSALVRSLGYRVLEASGGQAALELLRTEDIDLLFSDAMMPEMTGFDLADIAGQSYPELRILLTSGSTEAWSAHDEDAGNEYEILGKPYRKSDLAVRIRTALASRTSLG